MRRVTLLLAIAIVAGPAREAGACTCADVEPAEAFASARAVFVGRVAGQSPPSGDVGRVRFVVEEAFSGVEGQAEVEVHSAKEGCGFGFPVPEGTFLVYAYGDGPEDLWLGLCSRTRLVADAAEDLELLRRLPPPGTGIRIHGRVVEVRPDVREDENLVLGPLAAVAVTVEREDGRRLDLVTDEDGRYEARSLPPGKYRIEVVPPPPYTGGSLAGREVRAWDDRATIEEDFQVRVDGRVRGRVLDPGGRPVTDASVFLLPLDRLDGEPSWQLSGSTDEAGRYEIEGVPAGRYLLAFEPQSAPSPERPYPSTYHPGVTDRSRATVLDLGRGQKVDGMDIRVPARLAVRTAGVQVVWPDGRPAAGALVVLRDVGDPDEPLEEYVSGGTADPEGRLTLQGIAGRSYLLTAGVEAAPGPDGERRWLEAEPLRLTMPRDAEDVAGLRLVVSRPEPVKDWGAEWAREAARGEKTVFVHLKLSDGSFGTLLEREALLDRAAGLDLLLAGSGAGEYGGHTFAGGFLVLRFYGPDADALFDLIAADLRTLAPPGSYAVKRHGTRGAREQRVELRR